MQFVIDDGVYKVARITGPQHNMLGIRLADSAGDVRVISLPVKNEGLVRIDGENVARQVRSGLLKANDELTKEYYISEIQFVSTDTYSSEVYELLTIELIKRIDCGGEFSKNVNCG
jgi:hypothetical protein